MRKTNRIDTHSLREEAENSEDKEAFKVLARMRNCRVGVGARMESPAKPIFFIEIIAILCADHHTLNLNSLENNMLILKKLKKRGYTFSWEEDGAVSCELEVPAENLTLEYLTAISIIKKHVE
jgi:pyruvate formate-lyase activating enzyme-like uncharacterized protein